MRLDRLDFVGFSYVFHGFSWISERFPSVFAGLQASKALKAWLRMCRAPLRCLGVEILHAFPSISGGPQGSEALN